MSGVGLVGSVSVGSGGSGWRDDFGWFVAISTGIPRLRPKKRACAREDMAVVVPSGGAAHCHA